MIPYSRQLVSAKDIEAVSEVLKSDYLTQGEVVPHFEHAISEYCCAKYAVATCNATAALHLACLSLGINSSSLVWIAATSFVASANCARYCGAQIDFIDTNPKSGLVSIQALERKLLRAISLNTIPDAIVVVHLGGQSCDMKKISSLCRPYGIKIIEDACHALSGRYENKPIGSCQYSDCAVFSFHPVKPLTSGEGGMLVCNNAELAERARLYCNHGIERDASKLNHENSAEWYYEQHVLGFNYRLSDIHAALGLSQLQQLDSNRAQRESQAKQYLTLLKEVGVMTVLDEKQLSQSALHLFPVLFPNRESRDEAFSIFRRNKFGVNIHYLSIPSHPYYRDLGFRCKTFPGAQSWADCELSLPMHAFVDGSTQRDVVSICVESVGGVSQVIGVV